MAKTKPEAAQIVWVSPDRIEEPKHLLRTVDEDNPELLDLLSSMERYGFKPTEPLDVCPGKGERLILKDGMQRLWCARKRGLDSVPVVIGPRITEDEILERSINANSNVRTRPAEFGRALAKLREIYPGDTFEMTAKRACHKVEWVKKMLGLAPLEGQAADLVNKRKIGIEAGLALVSLQRAGVAVSDDLLSRAQKEPAADFVADVNAILKRKKGKSGAEGKLRPVGDFKKELARARKDKSTDAGYVEALLWALRLDPASIEEAATR